MLLFIPDNILFYGVIHVISNSVESIFNVKPYYGENYFQMCYIMPHFSFGRIFLEYLIDDGAGKLWFKLIMPLPLETAWWVSVFTIPFYFLIYMYLDAIIPNTYGVAQPWCFCCKVKSKRSLLLRVFCCKKEKDEVLPGEESPIKQAGDPLIVMLNTSK
jgi:hypothetical protein